MTKKIVKPINPMIYKVAAEMAGVFYDAGRSSGLTSKFKTPEAFARANIEKFLPKAIQILMEMLKPHSGRSEHEKEAIYTALMDPVNDPDLMTSKVDIDLNQKRLEDIISNYDKNQLKFNELTPKSKPSFKQKLLNTANPLASKAN